MYLVRFLTGGCAVCVSDYYHAEEAADGVTERYPEIDVWYLGGRSLGGAMAANHAADRNDLPADTTEVMIEGGCHAGFGAYGPQSGDGTPSIPSKEQIGRTAEGIWNMVQNRG